MAHSIIYAASCDQAADALGGYAKIDIALEAAIQGLMVNPYSFPKIESFDFYHSARYIPTKPIKDVPALVWVFEIDINNNVILKHVEEFEPY